MINFLDETKKSEEETPKKEKAEKIEMTEPVLDVPVHSSKKTTPKVVESILTPPPQVNEPLVKEKPKEENVEKRNKVSFFKELRSKFTKIFHNKTELKEKSNTKMTKPAKTEFSQGSNISLLTKKIVIIPRIVQDRLLILTAAVIVIAGVFFIILFYTNWYFEKIRFQVENYAQQIRTIESQTKPLLALSNKISKLEKKALGVNEILDNHIYWTKFFGLLEKYTMKNVYFGNFAADTSGNIHMVATAKDLAAVSHQLVLFQNAPDFIKDVKISNIGINPEGISFSVDLKLIKGVFTK